MSFTRIFLSREVTKTYFFIKLQKVRSTFYFILLYNIYLHIYLYKTIIIYNSETLFTRVVKDMNCNPVLYSYNLLFFLF